MSKDTISLGIFGATKICQVAIEHHAFHSYAEKVNAGIISAPSFLPIIYGGIFPAGLILYWIVMTVVMGIQQYLVVGWGGMFPLFGWTPRFAVDHQPRFPVAMPTAPTAPSRSPHSRPAATSSTPGKKWNKTPGWTPNSDAPSKPWAPTPQ